MIFKDPGLWAVWAQCELKMDGDDESSPFTTRQFAAVIDGVHTDFFLSGYENRFFFVVSQLGKLGTLVRNASCPPPHLSNFEQPFSPFIALDLRQKGRFH